MRGLYWEEWEISAEFESPARTVTEADIVMYAGLSGDYNPLHTNEEYAKQTQFGSRIAHGPLVYGIAAGLLFQLHLLSLIHISEPTRLGMISYAVFCLKKKKILTPIAS